MQISKILNQITFTGFYPPHVVPPKEPDLDKLDEQIKCYKQPVKDEFIKSNKKTRI